MTDKSEIQARIEKVESELAMLKADLAKCDCTDGIEQERCWHGVSVGDGVATTWARTKQDVADFSPNTRPAYMPECRAVTEMDAINASSAYLKTGNSEEMACKLHKLGFRMKVAS